MKVLVVGSTGFLGTQICRLALEKGHEVRGLVRAASDRDRVETLRDLGVETVEGDLKDAESLAPAVEGMDAVISTATATRSRGEGDGVESVDRDGQIALVDEAGTAGVERFVLVSLSGNLGQGDPLSEAKRAVEARVRKSGMRYTILRPTFFMEVWLSPALGFDPHGGSVTIYGDGTRPVSWISLGDVAQFAVGVLDEESAADAVDAVLELGGPEALSPLEVVRIFEEEAGRSIPVQHVPTAELQARHRAATDSMDRSFAALMLAYAEGDAVPMEGTMERFPLRLRTVREYARDSAPTS